MTKEEFKAMPKDTKLVQIIYDYEKGVTYIKYFQYRDYKNFGHFMRDCVNKYNNHYITSTCDGSPEMWCTEDKLNIALENMKEILVKHEKKIIDKASTNIKLIKDSGIMIDTSLLDR